MSTRSPAAILDSCSHQILFSLIQKPPCDKPPVTVPLLHPENKQAENLRVFLEGQVSSTSIHGKQRFLSHMLLMLCTSPFVQSKSNHIRFPWSHTQGCCSILLSFRNEQLDCEASEEGWKSWKHWNWNAARRQWDRGELTAGADTPSPNSQEEEELGCAPCCQSRKVTVAEACQESCHPLWPLMVFAALLLKMMIQVIKLAGTKTDGELSGASEGFPVFSEQQQFIFHLHMDSEQGAEQKCFAIAQ